MPQPKGWLIANGAHEFYVGSRLAYVLAYNEKADLWFAHQRSNETHDHVTFVSFASGTYEDMKTLVEVTAKLE